MRTVLHAFGRPFGTWRVPVRCPPFKRWAIFGRPCGTLRKAELT
jgi:hypothetical protein